MKKMFKIFSTITALSMLSACGAGMDAGGGPGGIPPVAPISGMDFQVASDKLGVTNAEEKEFAFFNSPGTRNVTSGGITFTAGHEQTDGTRSGDDQVHFRFNLASGGTREEDTWYHSDGSMDSNQTVYRVDTVDVNGNDVLFAQKVNLDVYTGEDQAIVDYVYIPANGDSQTYAGMVGIQSTWVENSFVGIFGQRTTQDQVANLNGSVTYRGVSNAVANYVGSTTNDLDGNYTGTATAQINFDAPNAPTFSSSVDMTGLVHRTTNLNVNLNGTLNQDGSLNVTSASTQGGAATATQVNGGLFGPNGDTLGYTYQIEGQPQYDNDGPIRVTGGSLLNRD